MRNFLGEFSIHFFFVSSSRSVAQRLLLSPCCIKLSLTTIVLDLFAVFLLLSSAEGVAPSSQPAQRELYEFDVMKKFQPWLSTLPAMMSCERKTYFRSFNFLLFLSVKKFLFICSSSLCLADGKREKHSLDMAVAA